jgi:FKBP-type peptidyl-prolyl cis-trans isomerase FkpA
VIQSFRAPLVPVFHWLPILLLIGAAACHTSTSPSTSGAPYSQTDLVVGAGALASTGNRATVAYTGWLYDSTKTNGKGTQFDTSPSFAFTIGAGQVIKGWDQGVAGMRIGGQRRLVLPPELAYGSAGAGGGVIPPNATLVFDITLNGVQ